MMSSFFFMDSLSQFGVVTQQLAVGLQTWLVGTMIVRRTYREHPAFVAYCAFLVLTSAMAFVAFLCWKPEDYAKIYWSQSALECIFAAVMLGELHGSRTWGMICGGLLAIPMGLYGFPISSFRFAGFALSSAAFLALFRAGSNKAIATGAVVLLVFPAILYLPVVPLFTRFIPTFAWIVAQCIWIRGLPDYAPV
jgi:hypothetical protein